jgi:hypothetical protein
VSRRRPEERRLEQATQLWRSLDVSYIDHHQLLALGFHFVEPSFVQLVF